ncbi:MAG: hypothetical protein ACRDWI_00450 [Jiangellaceae bacterium]
MGPVLPWVSLACLAIGVLAARDRRRTLMRASLGVAASMVLLAVALAVGRSLYLDRLPARVSMAAAADVFDTVVRFLRTGVRAVLVAALVVAGGAFLAGPSGTAVRTRAAFQRLLDAAGGNGNAWVRRNRSALRAGIVALACVAFVFWEQPTAAVGLVLAALAVLALVVVEVLATSRADRT